MSVIAGLVFFNEAEHFSLTQSIVFPVGVGLTIVGVFALARKGVANEVVVLSNAATQLIDDAESNEKQPPQPQQQQQQQQQGVLNPNAMPATVLELGTPGGPTDPQSSTVSLLCFVTLFFNSFFVFFDFFSNFC